MEATRRESLAVVGGGLAGVEAAWQLARRHFTVFLYEMRPRVPSAAHRTAALGELVCSNSFKSVALTNAHGLLKAELALQGSLVLAAARRYALPADQALAVDREPFADWLTARIAKHPRIVLVREEVRSIEALLDRHRRVLLASGPLTSETLANALQRFLGRRHLAFYDAISPVVLGESLRMEHVFRANRHQKTPTGGQSASSAGQDSQKQETKTAPAIGISQGGDYLNCPLDEAAYRRFVAELRAADTLVWHPFESLRTFEGCMPIEELAARGPLTLAHGPMKPIGLRDAQGKRPFAVVQLRQENASASLWGLVGFQTRLTWPAQRRLFRSIPALAEAEFARLGSMHRNTFIEAPSVLNADLETLAESRLSIAGQLTGVEGYVESTAMGLHAARRIAYALWCADGGTAQQVPPRPSPQTMSGGLLRYLQHTPPARFQPMNSNFGLVDALEMPARQRHVRRQRLAQRALTAIYRLEQQDPWHGSYE